MKIDTAAGCVFCGIPLKCIVATNSGELATCLHWIKHIITYIR